MAAKKTATKVTRSKATAKTTAKGKAKPVAYKDVKGLVRALRAGTAPRGLELKIHATESTVSLKGQTEPVLFLDQKPADVLALFAAAIGVKKVTQV